MLHLFGMNQRDIGATIAPRSTRKRLLLASVIFITLTIGIASTQMASAQQTQTNKETAFDPISEAKALLDNMDAGNFAAVYARFDKTMAAAVSADQLRAGWTSLVPQLGAFKGRGEARSAEKDGMKVVMIPLSYEKAQLNAIFSFTTDGHVAGLLIKPEEALTSTAKTAAPAVPNNAHYTERQLVISNVDGDDATGLPATLAMPKGKGPFPAVVLVHGSGPQDRDETIGPNRPFLEIARGLASKGIAVLRYEKRSKVRPQDYANGVTIDSETTDDAVLALATLRKQTGIDPSLVYVLGHSQGGMMAPRIGQRDPKIAGLILLAAPSRPLLDILIEQNRRMAVLNDGKTSAEESTAIEALVRSVAAIRSGKDIPNTESPMGLPAAYWHSMEAVDPVAEAQALKQPMLILQGARDIQVVDADWQGWKEAFHDNKRVTFKLYETLNHLAIAGEGDGNLQEYQTPGHVDAGLIEDIANWISVRRKH